MELSEDDPRDGEVSLQLVDHRKELGGVQVGHVGPFLDLVEEARKSQLAASQESRQGGVGLTDSRQVGGVAGSVHGTSQPVELRTLKQNRLGHQTKNQA